jgi:tetratricopeptide (TPR) repeat protein
VLGGVNVVGKGNQEEAWPYLQKALDIAVEIGARDHEAFWLGCLGELKRMAGEYQESLNYQDSALRIAVEGRNRLGEACCLGEMGALHRLLGNHDKALEFALRCLKITEELGDRRGIGERCCLCGQLMEEENKPCEAARFFERAYEISVDLKLGDVRIADDKAQLDRARAACEKLMTESKSDSVKGN